MNAGGSALEELCRAVPKGRAELDYEELRILSKLTRQLIGERPDAAEEYRRFWDESYARLDSYLKTLQQKDGTHDDE